MTTKGGRRTAVLYFCRKMELSRNSLSNIFVLHLVGFVLVEWWCWFCRHTDILTQKVFRFYPSDQIMQNICSTRACCVRTFPDSDAPRSMGGVPRLRALQNSIVGGFNGFYGNGLIVGGFNGFYGNGLIVGGFNGFCGKILIVVIS